MLVNDFHNAVKSALVFAGKLHHFSELDPFVRIVHGEGQMLLIAADAYVVAFVRVEDGGEAGLDVCVRASDLKNALPQLKALIRDKVTAEVVEQDDGFRIHRSDGQSAWFHRMDGVPVSMLGHLWRMPPAYPALDPHNTMVSRVALSVDFFARFKQAAWNSAKDTMVFEPGPFPNSPVVVRMGDYLIAKAMPRQADVTSRDAWVDLLGHHGLQAKCEYDTPSVVRVEEVPG